MQKDHKQKLNTDKNYVKSNEIKSNPPKNRSSTKFRKDEELE